MVQSWLECHENFPGSFLARTLSECRAREALYCFRPAYQLVIMLNQWAWQQKAEMTSLRQSRLLGPSDHPLLEAFPASHRGGSFAMGLRVWI